MVIKKLEVKHYSFTSNFYELGLGWSIHQYLVHKIVDLWINMYIIEVYKLVFGGKCELKTR